MKIQCVTCGVHFPSELQRTYTEDCGFWKSHGMGTAPSEIKSRVWEWCFYINADEIFGKYKMNFAFSFQFLPVALGKTFKEIVPNWENMTEEEQQNFERDWFKEQQRQSVSNIQIPTRKIEA